MKSRFVCAILFVVFFLTSVPAGGQLEGSVYDTEVQAGDGGAGGTQADREYWCDMAMKLRQDVETAERELDKIGRESIYGRVRVEDRGSLVKARTDLNQAEKNLYDFEADALKRGVPVDWLNCR